MSEIQFTRWTDRLHGVKQGLLAPSGTQMNTNECCEIDLVNRDYKWVEAVDKHIQKKFFNHDHDYLLHGIVLKAHRALYERAKQMGEVTYETSQIDASTRQFIAGFSSVGHAQQATVMGMDVYSRTSRLGYPNNSGCVPAKIAEARIRNYLKDDRHCNDLIKDIALQYCLDVIEAFQGFRGTRSYGFSVELVQYEPGVPVLLSFSALDRSGKRCAKMVTYPAAVVEEAQFEASSHPENRDPKNILNTRTLQ